MTNDTSFANHAKEETTKDNVDNQTTGIQVGDRSFDTQEDLIKSWTNAQEHIRTIESENAEHKEALAKSRGVEEVLEKLNGNTADDTRTENDKAVDNKGYLTEAELNDVLDRRAQSMTAETNADKAMTLARDALGTGFIAKLDAKAEELSISIDAAMDLARKSPDAFAKLFLPSNSNVSHNSSGDINSAAIPPREPDAPSMRVSVGATSSELRNAWNAAKPKLIED